jgi:hypothetical protein
MIDKTMCEILWGNISNFYVNLRVEVAAVSRNRYGVEKTVDNHTILINAIQFYVFKKYDRQNHVWSFMTKYLWFLCKFTSWSGETPTDNFSDVFLSWTRIMSVLIGWPIKNTLTPHGLARLLRSIVYKYRILTSPAFQPCKYFCSTARKSILLSELKVIKCYYFLNIVIF